MFYLDGECSKAEESYEASIKSAIEHKFYNEAAVAHEMYGIFLLENGRVDEGVEQLNIALDKYEKWGAVRKVRELEQLLKTTDPTHLRQELKIRL